MGRWDRHRKVVQLWNIYSVRVAQYSQSSLRCTICTLPKTNYLLLHARPSLQKSLLLSNFLWDTYVTSQARDAKWNAKWNCIHFRIKLKRIFSFNSRLLHPAMHFAGRAIAHRASRVVLSARSWKHNRNLYQFTRTNCWRDRQSVKVKLSM